MSEENRIVCPQCGMFTNITSMGAVQGAMQLQVDEMGNILGLVPGPKTYYYKCMDCYKDFNIAEQDIQQEPTTLNGMIEEEPDNEINLY